jgi:hypothetical protein
LRFSSSRRVRVISHKRVQRGRKHASRRKQVWTLPRRRCEACMESIGCGILPIGCIRQNRHSLSVRCVTRLLSRRSRASIRCRVGRGCQQISNIGISWCCLRYVCRKRRESLCELQIRRWRQLEITQKRACPTSGS